MLNELCSNLSSKAPERRQIRFYFSKQPFKTFLMKTKVFRRTTAHIW